MLTRLLHDSPGLAQAVPMNDEKKQEPPSLTVRKLEQPREQNCFQFPVTKFMKRVKRFNNSDQYQV
jgi:hypothetical protein